MGLVDGVGGWGWWMGLVDGVGGWGWWMGLVDGVGGWGWWMGLPNFRVVEVRPLAAGSSARWGCGESVGYARHVLSLKALQVKRGRLAGVSVCLALTAVAFGCSSGSATGPSRATGSAIISAAVVVHRVPPPGSRCSRARIELDVGAIVPAPYLASIQFLNAATGVGLTASRIACLIGPGGVETEPFPVWEVVSTNGGRAWRTTGSALPSALDPNFADANLAFSTTRRGWVEAGGALGYTSDGGHAWKVVGLGETVTALQATGQTVAALASQPTKDDARVWLLSPAGGIRGRTSRIRITGMLLATIDELAIMPRTSRVVVAVPQRGSDYLVEASGVGSSWSRLAEPCPGWGIAAVLATGGDRLAAVCSNGTNMDHDPKIFAVSLDGGRKWQARSAWRNQEAPDPSGLPFADFLSVATSPGGDLRMATTTGAAVSRDGGRIWAPLEIAGPESPIPGNSFAGAQFSFVSNTHGWLLLQSEALLRTIDGSHWTVLSSAPSGT